MAARRGARWPRGGGRDGRAAGGAMAARRRALVAARRRALVAAHLVADPLWTSG
jgi:hypothetical protein